MLFNSFAFLLFFLIVYCSYLCLRHRHQNYLLLAASYCFYGFWDWRFLSLILLSTVVDYFCGIAIYETTSEKRRKYFLLGSLIFNLGVLATFKYFGFFTDNFATLLSWFGFTADWRLINIILPVGISFYTFQTLSYTIDIYKGRMKPTRKFFNFAIYVSFFPQLVAGPIERAIRLLPQIENPRQLTFDGLRMGAWLILLGYFKKVVVADNFAYITQPVFSNPEQAKGIGIILAVVAFAIQIYGDFSGYSDIARGLAKLMGIDLMTNFRRPYFACNPRDYWQRWHISLSSWLRDYLYIPLGGNQKNRWLTNRNLYLTMALGGLWHGAAWHYVAWGAFHGTILCLHRLLQGWRLLDQPKAIRMGCFFTLTCISYLIFAVQDLSHVGILARNIFVPVDQWTHTYLIAFAFNCIIASPLLIIEIWEERHSKDNIILDWAFPIKGTCYLTFFTVLILFGVMDNYEFIYFQF